MKKKRRKPKPPGTRAGVPNHERPAVASFPAACPSCRCTRYRVEGHRTDGD